ncbi:MAG: hypothetical protein ABIZ95_01600 [Pyrinomonadaceae bacterium]
MVITPVILAAIGFTGKLLLGGGLNDALALAGTILYVNWVYFFYYRFAVAYRKLTG